MDFLIVSTIFYLICESVLELRMEMVVKKNKVVCGFVGTVIVKDGSQR